MKSNLIEAAPIDRVIYIRANVIQRDTDGHTAVTPYEGRAHCSASTGEWLNAAGLSIRMFHDAELVIIDWREWETSDVDECASENPGVLNHDQLDGCACVVCGGNGEKNGMLPLGLETSISSEVFRCDRAECAVDPATVQAWITASEKSNHFSGALAQT